jgi:hypothetical protein
MVHIFTPPLYIYNNLILHNFVSNIKSIYTTPSNGYLGSRTDEERSELRDVMRIADVRESSNL